MLYRFLSPRLYTADGGAQGGAPSGGGADPAEGLRNALQRHQNDAMALAAQLYTENYQLRDRNRALQGQAPAEGSVVLSKEQAAHWSAYQQLGAPDALTTQLQGAQTAQQELGTLKRQALLRTAAEAAGYKPSVLGQLAGDLPIEVREIEVDGKKRPAAFVKPAEGQELTLAAYAQQNWGDFMPALQAQAVAPTGVPFPAQNSGGGASPADVATTLATEFQSARDKAFNPLRPAAPATNQGQQ